MVTISVIQFLPGMLANIKLVTNLTIILPAVAAIVTTIIWIIRIPKRSHRIAASIILVLTVALTTWLSIEKERGCGRFADGLLYDDEAPAFKRDYVTYENKGDISGGNMKQLRKKFIKELAERADSAMEKSGFTPYAKRLAPFLESQEAISKEVIRLAREKYFVYVSEGLDSSNCSYTLKLSLAKQGAKLIDSLISLARDNSCISETIAKLMLPDLREHGQVSFSFYDIFSELCKSCPRDPRVIEWRARCQANGKGCDSVYFQKGSYDLSLTSMVILNCVNSRLQLNDGKQYTVEFHGFTDPTPVTHIPYNAGGSSAAKGTLLPSTSAGQQMAEILDNDQLSFARAFSCYTYLRSNLYTKQLQVFYTGHGINLNGGPLNKQRSVTITIKKNN